MAIVSFSGNLAKWTGWIHCGHVHIFDPSCDSDGFDVWNCDVVRGYTAPAFAQAGSTSVIDLGECIRVPVNHVGDWSSGFVLA
jgi:hypothetical protein